ncbi:hypothetical protein [Halobacteriovorax sp. JY17]|uniref:hypothetical protein n=1 Tax=Halobacteriovorax sp. JY17 TaxID=2014617 RepID=UPI000C37E3DA|nr:hypothetical protein [Halobacteriovorax sp. JY17]PIK16027.1 MAG: hypothetical protein CES88_04670 [Halobacteriovorax sp. JY17]
MKKKIIWLIVLSSSIAYAGKTEESFEELKDTIHKVKVLDEAKSGPNSINYECQHCLTEVEVEGAIVLDKEEVVMDRTMFNKGTNDNEFIIQRTKDTPDDVTIKFKEKYRVCQKTVAHQNPLSGQIGFSCLFSTTEYREETIQLDFSDRKLEGESEVIKVRLVKLDSRNKGFINASFKDQTGRGISSNRGSKFLFFGTKYSLK